MSDATPAPVVVQLPLPTGVASLEQYLSLQGAAVTIAITVAVAFALAGWDYFVLLVDEIALYRSSDKTVWKSPAFFAFVVLRYAGILGLLPGIFFSSAQSDNCQFAASISQAGCVLVVASSGIIFSYRVFAMWHGNRYIYALVGLFYFVMLGCWIATATQLKATTGPATPFLSNCTMLPVPSWSPIGYASSVAFDTLVLLLSLAKLRGSLIGHSRVSQQIYRDNLIYFFLVTSTNIVVLSIQSLGSDHALLKPNALPYSTLMTYAMGSRVFLNLRLLHKRQKRAQDGIPMTNSSQGTNSAFSTRPPANVTGGGVVVNYSQYTKTDGEAYPRYSEADTKPRTPLPPLTPARYGDNGDV